MIAELSMLYGREERFMVSKTKKLVKFLIPRRNQSGEEYSRHFPSTVPLRLLLRIQEETTIQSKCELDLVRPVNICACLDATRLITL